MWDQPADASDSILVPIPDSLWPTSHSSGPETSLLRVGIVAAAGTVNSLDAIVLKCEDFRFPRRWVFG
jgi:hypothetical protein